MKPFTAVANFLKNGVEPVSALELAVLMFLLLRGQNAETIRQADRLVRMNFRRWWRGAEVSA